MWQYLIEKWRFRRRRREALQEIRRNDWRSPLLGDARRRLRWHG